MMDLLLVRDVFTDKSTTGRLFVQECFTLEDVVRPVKVAGETAIPAGRYEVILKMSPKRGKRVPWLVNVPGFDAIEIHTGNEAEDTRGCILVGKERYENSILLSRGAYANLFDKIETAIADRDKVWLEIIEQR